MKRFCHHGCGHTAEAHILTDEEYQEDPDYWNNEIIFLATKKNWLEVSICSECGSSSSGSDKLNKDLLCDQCKKYCINDKHSQIEHKNCYNKECMCNCRASEDGDFDWTDTIERMKNKPDLIASLLN